MARRTLVGRTWDRLITAVVVAFGVLVAVALVGYWVVQLGYGHSPAAWLIGFGVEALIAASGYRVWLRSKRDR